uniref:Uncharacterized protein n=1 Tax=viral metagenome TaxID=1070528 RepID=A0A6C0B7N8_9ZZZZ
MYLRNISNFTNVSDYLPILNGALITDILVILLALSGYLKSLTLKTWYKSFGLSAVLADVFVIVIVVIVTRWLYSMFFKSYSLLSFIILAVSIQCAHDLLFGKLLDYIPTEKSQIFNTFKQYADEHSFRILFADAQMVVSTIIIGSLMASFDFNINIITFIIMLYHVPYLIYSF